MRLLRNLFSSPAKAAGPNGRRAYVIGDVHGCLNLLRQLLERIEDDIRARPSRRTTLVFLGDLVDRGPDSAGVVEFLRTYRPAFASTSFLMGNHEETMLRVLAGEESLVRQWMKFGGSECAQSYGADPAALRRMSPTAAIATLRKVVPPMHFEFLSCFGDTISFGNYLFVHAGIRPGTNLAEQALTDLHWIREPFLQDERDHGFIVVHGHTICEEIEVYPNRIGIDTGAYRTGTLSAMAIEGTERWFLQTDNAMSQSGDFAPSPGFSAAGGD
jgi:serine/threonine protein phosphatase 1